MVDTHCLVLQGVTRAFGGLIAVDDISLEVRRGERRAIIGPNGAGKTTLFGLISGEIPLTKGQIQLFGKKVTRMPAHKRISLGLARTYQVTNLFPELSVLQNLLLAAQGVEKTKYVMYRPISSYKHLYERSEQLLHEFDFLDRRDALIKNLSHGEQRQIDICLALIGQPHLLLLDEPTAGLSPAETILFTSMLKKLDAEMTILLIEHDMGVAFELADQITVLHQGKLLATGSKEEVQANTQVQEIYLGTE